MGRLIIQKNWNTSVTLAKKAMIYRQIQCSIHLDHQGNYVRPDSLNFNSNNKQNLSAFKYVHLILMCQYILRAAEIGFQATTYQYLI